MIVDRDDGTVDDFKTLLRKKLRVCRPLHVIFGLSCEKSGRNKKATEKYEEFSGIRKDADPGIPEVEDAKDRLKKLRVESRE